MKCEDCGYCKQISLENGMYEINCVYEGDTFNVSEANAAEFHCEDYVKAKKQSVKKDNIMVILTSGRDMIFRDSEISSRIEIDRIIQNLGDDDFAVIGGVAFRVRDIAAYSYIGD